METTSADAGGAPPAAASTAARSFDTRWVRIQGDESDQRLGDSSLDIQNMNFDRGVTAETCSQIRADRL